MSAINELREILEQTQTASFVTTMLRDISATKLQTIRAAFDANHEYYLELHGLMQLVQTHNAEYLAAHHTQDKTQRVYVAVTSNKRFYGTLNHQIIHMLHQTLEKDMTAQCIVIGQTGKQILDASGLSLQAKFIQFTTDEPTSAEMLSFIQDIAEFSEIIVVHPTFVNSFTQHAMITDLTHSPSPEEIEKQKKVDYLFEPEIPKIVEFFKTQIRLVLFARVVLETRLALTGARLMKMQRARERAEELLRLQRRTIHKEISTVQSMRLLEAFAGFRTKNTL